MTSDRQRGQATVEFALVIPLLLVALLTVVQVSVVAYAQLAVTHAAREAVRTVAVDPTTDLSALEAALDASLVVNNGDAQTQVVHVVASREIPLVSPLFAPLLENQRVRAEAQMRTE